MYKKVCDHCKKSSFSSSEIGKWICPICGSDLTGNPFFDAMTRERVFVSYAFKTLIPHSGVKQISRNYRKRIGLSYYSKMNINP
ncbi:hypothetical protein ACOSZF_04490 [Cytobacillus firmus]|uniref:hypothetical protein n=1 Tax=Cytobacillus firmus TaxID=1399 RepID=UPI00077CBD75|nr:hypothetical protein [Cytobacillus firmus]MBG9543808.1 hypothetical protein [Cytobacillus firmus]MBG9546887.1 hypothetical protein [Cytobacillus firmus]MBG9552629.1 hypothetical protein [Cytobacillus firmus]MBG9556945.1 hypothetical protein [Cytobacillus firmus]MBG9574169.1 hypothetical protein [Cytobacillus firmus]